MKHEHPSLTTDYGAEVGLRSVHAEGQLDGLLLQSLHPLLALAHEALHGGQQDGERLGIQGHGGLPLRVYGSAVFEIGGALLEEGALRFFGVFCLSNRGSHVLLVAIAIPKTHVFDRIECLLGQAN